MPSLKPKAFFIYNVTQVAKLYIYNRVYHMYKKSVFKIFTLVAILICCALAGKSQDILKNYDLSTIKVDKLTDAQILKFKQQIDASGLTEDQAEQLAISKGMPVAEVQKLRTRLQQLQTSTPKQNPNNPNSQLQNNTQQQNYNNSYDTTNNQQNIDTTTKKPLINPRIFGSEMFNNSTLNFQPNIPVATPTNYIVGPGDQLNIEVFGVQETTIPLTVSPEGNITIPNVGQVQVSGISIEDATQKLKTLMGKTAYPTLRSGASRVSINVSQIKSINVTIIGSNKPGNYTLPSLATAFNALFVAGGPTEFGSFRQIELVRDNKVFKTIDLYRFLVNGDESDNVTLRNNDVIRIPTYKTRVIIDGYIKRPGIFEMLPGETLQNLLTYSSGFSDSAYRASVKIIQFTNKELSVKDVEAADFNNYIMQPGDSVTVGKVLARYTNRITISGAVFREGIYELSDGMNLNDLLKRADGLREDAFMQRAQIFRLKPDLTKEVLSFNPADSMQQKSIMLRREDSVVITSIFDLRDNYYVNILGEIRNPGYYNYSDSLSLKDLIIEAGGFTEAAFPQKIEIARLISRDTLTAQDVRASMIIQINGMNDLSSSDKNVQLRASDLITIRRKPGFLPFQTITVSGELQYPGPYVLDKRVERISDIVKRAGGFTPEAYLEGAYIKRYNYNDAASDIKQQTISNIQSQLADSTKLLEQQTTKQFDQIPLEMSKILAHPDASEDVVLLPGDEFIVPKYNPQVKISGNVLFPSQVPFKNNYNMHDYLSAAGGVSDNGKKRKIYVVYANGKASSTHGFLFFKSYPKIKPGTEIIVPSKPDKTNHLTTPELIGLSSALASLAGVVIAILRN